MTEIVRVKDNDGLVHFTARDSQFIKDNDVVEVDEQGNPVEVPDAATVDSSGTPGDAGPENGESIDGTGGVDDDGSVQRAGKAQPGSRRQPRVADRAAGDTEHDDQSVDPASSPE